MNLHRPGRSALALALIGSTIFAISAATAREAPQSERPRTTLPGYLGATVPDEKIFLPPPPADKSIAGRADMSVFKATRALAGTPRWGMATSDAAVSTQAMLGTFSCALGVRLDPVQAPVLARLSGRAMSDAVKVVGLAKDRYQRPRPFLRRKGPVCTATEGLAASGSYPSGHATAGWLYALILAELAPANASQVLARGRAFGESRVVCGVHYVSDVDAGRTTASALFATLHGDPDFQADMAAARRELSALSARSAAVDSRTCATENAALSSPGW